MLSQIYASQFLKDIQQDIYAANGIWKNIHGSPDV